jgi:membrane protein implicated in regulation of membrane protease activity
VSESDPSIRQLIASVQSDAQKLLKAQAELAGTELKGSQQEAAATGGMFAGAAFTAVIGVIFVLVALAYGLVALGLPVWAGFLIVAVLLLIVAAILAAVGKKRSKKIKGPELAKAEWARTKQVLSGKQPEVLPAQRPTQAVQERAGAVRRATQ